MIFGSCTCFIPCNWTEFMNDVGDVEGYKNQHLLSVSLYIIVPAWKTDETGAGSFTVWASPFQLLRENRLRGQPVAFLPLRLYLIIASVVLVFVNTQHNHTGECFKVKFVYTTAPSILCCLPI